MMHDCIFHKCSECAVLKFKKCPEKCKFHKTEEEFCAAQKRAEELLKRKGLEPCIKHLDNGTVIVSTRRIKK